MRKGAANEQPCKTGPSLISSMRSGRFPCCSRAHGWRLAWRRELAPARSTASGSARFWRKSRFPPARSPRFSSGACCGACFHWAPPRARVRSASSSRPPPQPHPVRCICRRLRSGSSALHLRCRHLLFRRTPGLGPGKNLAHPPRRHAAPSQGRTGRLLVTGTPKLRGSLPQPGILALDRRLRKNRGAGNRRIAHAPPSPTDFLPASLKPNSPRSSPMSSPTSSGAILPRTLPTA